LEALPENERALNLKQVNIAVEILFKLCKKKSCSNFTTMILFIPKIFASIMIGFPRQLC